MKRSSSYKHCAFRDKNRHSKPYCWKNQREKRAKAKTIISKAADVAGLTHSTSTTRCEADSDFDDFDCYITHAASRSLAS